MTRLVIGFRVMALIDMFIDLDIMPSPAPYGIYGGKVIVDANCDPWQFRRII